MRGDGAAVYGSPTEHNLNSLQWLKGMPGADALRHMKHSCQRGMFAGAMLGSKQLIGLLTRETVASGIFKGMQFTRRQVHGSPYAKLLGTYEMELHGVLRELPREQLEKVIDVGGAEGYYAVGAALNLNVRQVVVFELLDVGRRLIKEIAEKNGVVQNVEIRGQCREPDLHAVVGTERHEALLMDVEGAELELLSERVIDKLRGSTLIIEAHDFLHPECTRELVERLSPSHTVGIISSRKRKRVDFPINIPLPRSIKLEMMNEGRPGSMNWVVAKPKV